MPRGIYDRSKPRFLKTTRKAAKKAVKKAVKKVSTNSRRKPVVEKTVKKTVRKVAKKTVKRAARKVPAPTAFPNLPAVKAFPDLPSVGKTSIGFIAQELPAASETLSEKDSAALLGNMRKEFCDTFDRYNEALKENLQATTQPAAALGLSATPYGMLDRPYYSGAVYQAVDHTPTFRALYKFSRIKSNLNSRLHPNYTTAAANLTFACHQQINKLLDIVAPDSNPNNH